MINGEIKTTYDELIYNSSSFVQCDIDYLHCLAKMHGLDICLPQNSAVLEIGCGCGGNILPQALNTPNAKFVGIDLSSKQIEIAKDAAKRMEISNIYFKDIDMCEFADFINGGGLSEFLNLKNSDIKFDFIIMHGVYSWIPTFVRAKFLEIVRDFLAPQGICFVSYNCYPGWKYLEIQRDFMRFSAAATPRDDKFQAALDSLTFKKVALDKMAYVCSDLYNEFRINIEKTHCDAILNTPNKSYLYHEYLEICNQPFYFLDFVDDIGEFGLGYVCDSFIEPYYEDLNDKTLVEFAMLNYPKHHQKEQIFDFLNNSRFRNSIITHASNKIELNEEKMLENIKDFHMIFTQQDINLKERAKGTIDEPLVNALYEVYPASLSVKELGEIVPKNDLLRAFFDLSNYAQIFIRLRTTKFEAVHYKENKARIKQNYIPYIKYFLDTQSEHLGVSSIFNMPIYFDKNTLETSLKFDGKNSIDNIVKFIYEKFQKAKILPTIEKDGKIVEVIKDKQAQIMHFRKLIKDFSKNLTNGHFFEKI
ncbi:class I SAM-dependent methyltransferase [Campylobacter hyointestinalis]|uniref:class I SAM-dependent methyltransferase n=1 Tax=Campylobacter hyointestinalis TaxID=198 RepID=UPI000DCE953E|nr:class I SAM-dependent methyltransferase [Campylobacter hyointestinalis]RAZ51089.1 SAM-dependent methyltransferase [Campylobacter hyointestinalis subsp. lawsonii]